MNTRNKHKTLIVFDLVSTLTDAGPRYAKAFENVCLEHGYVPPNKNQILSDLGNKNLKQIISDHIGKLSEESQADFMKDCNSKCDSLLYDVNWQERLFPNVRQVLSALHKSGNVLGIYTGTREDALQSQLIYHNIKEYFDSRYIRAKNNERDGFIDSSTLKSNQLVSILDEYKKDARNSTSSAVVVGDSSSDCIAARDVNLQFIGFASNENKMESLKKAGATVIVSNFDQLPNTLSKLSPKSVQPGASLKP